MALFIYVAVTGLLACLTSQAIKNFFNKKLSRKKIKFRNLYEDGGFPSSHTAYIISINTVCIIYMLVKSYQGNLTDDNVWTVISLMVLASLVIRDAVGIRYTVHILCKAGRVLLNLILNLGIERNDEVLKALLKNMEGKAGHKPYEVVGGFIWGSLIAFCTSLVYYKYTEFLLVLIPIMIIGLYVAYKYVEKRVEEDGD